MTKVKSPLQVKRDAVAPELAGIRKILFEHRKLRDTVNGQKAEMTFSGRGGAIQRRMQKAGSGHLLMSDSGTPDDADDGTSDSADGSS